MFVSRVNPPPRRDFPQVLPAAVVAVFAVIVVGGSAKENAGTEVSPWVWPIAGVLLAAAASIFEWHRLWRAWNPPLRLDPGALPATFDWDAVGRRMSDYYATGDAATASPDENDSVCLAIHDAVTVEYVDVVRDLLNGYEGAISSYRLDPELGVDQSGRCLLRWFQGTFGDSILRWCCPARTAATSCSWSIASTPRPAYGPTGHGA